jgi:hypothetical protein
VPPRQGFQTPLDAGQAGADLSPIRLGPLGRKVRVRQADPQFFALRLQVPDLSFQGFNVIWGAGLEELRHAHAVEGRQVGQFI